MNSMRNVNATPELSMHGEGTHGTVTVKQAFKHSAPEERVFLPGQRLNVQKVRFKKMERQSFYDNNFET